MRDAASVKSASRDCGTGSDVTVNRLADEHVAISRELVAALGVEGGREPELEDIVGDGLDPILLHCCNARGPAFGRADLVRRIAKDQRPHQIRSRRIKALRHEPPTERPQMTALLDLEIIEEPGKIAHMVIDGIGRSLPRSERPCPRIS